MSSFLYFTEELVRPVQLEDCQRLGLGYAFDCNPASMEITGRTPTGGKGWLFYDGKRIGDAFQGYKEPLQEWRQIPGTNVWVGFDKAKRPTPESLARPKQLDSELVMLADSKAWAIPKTKMFAGENGFLSSLATYIDLDENGHWRNGRVKGGHDNLLSLSDRMIEGMIYSLDSEEIEPLTDTELADIAVSLLAANYYVSAIEVALLEIVTNDDVLMSIARASVDFETAMAWALKKNASEQGGSTE